MSTSIMVKLNDGTDETVVSIVRSAAEFAVSEALILLFRTLSEKDRQLVLSDLCCTFHHYEERP